MASASVFCIQCGAANPQQAKFCFSCGQTVGKQEKAAVAIGAGNGQAGQLKADDVLKQRYRVLSQIGQGGFGAVYKAEDKELGQRVLAVKEMSQLNLGQQEIDAAVEAFKREALMLAGLKHEHLPRIYDHFSENDRWYLIMDYIEGETLEDRLSKSRDGSLPLAMALKIVEQLCDVLDYLHTRQPPIVFRDLKPANVILTPEGNLCLIDFGIARHFKPGQAKDTIAFGSPGYAAPEQYGKAQTTPRADIYSLGAILHQMVSGSDPSLSPFRFAPLSARHHTLWQLISRMLDMDAARRPASTGEVKQALQQIQNQPAPPAMPSLKALAVVPASQVLPAVKPASPSPYAPVLVHEHHYGVVRAVAWSPDSQYTASATDAIIRIWDAQAGRNITSYRDHTGMIKHMAWSPCDMRVASISEEDKVRIWDADTGKIISVYPGEPGAGRDQAKVLAWSYDGRYLTVANNGYVQIWDTNSDEVIAELKRRSSTSVSLSWSPDGTSLAIAHDNKVLIWQPGGRKRANMKTYHYSAQVNVVAWSPDGAYLASGGYDRTVHVWNAHNDQPIGVYRGHFHPVCAISWAPDSKRIVSGGYGEHINVWDATNGQGIISYYAHAGMALAVAWSPDGKSILSGGSDRRVCIWHAP